MSRASEVQFPQIHLDEPVQQEECARPHEAEVDMLVRMFRWRRRPKAERLLQLGDQRLIRGYGGDTYDGYGYQP